MSFDGWDLDELREEMAGPQVDEGVKVRCTNEGCPGHEDWWHPRTFTEYQGEHPHGGLVNFYEDDSHDCPECGQEGEEF